MGTGTGKQWAHYVVEGSFTEPDADERLALVGNIGEYNEVRWVVIGQADDAWRLLGTSEWLGSGFDAPPSSYLPPELLDFDYDGRYEVLNHYFKMQWGWTTSADELYRWDGRGLVSVWSAPMLVDNRMADNQDEPLSYRKEYQAEWEWVNLDGRGVDEILLRERAAFYVPGEGGYVADDAPSVGEESGVLAFRWDGEAFRPYAPDGPDATFAYVSAGELWLWQDDAARPLGAGNVREVYWAPDGHRLAWWAGAPAGGTAQGGVLGVYDLTAGTRREFSLGDAPSALRWMPDGQVAYALPGQVPALLDPRTGQQEPLPVASLGVWSPDGKRIAYVRDGSLYVYDPATGQEQALAVAPVGVGTAGLSVLPDVAWSPRGDWIACDLASGDRAWMGLVASVSSRPVSALDLLETFEGQPAGRLQFAWSPDGARLAVLTSDPHLGQQPVVLYLASMFLCEGNAAPVGRPEWQKVLELEPVTQTVRLAWSPDGKRVILAAGSGVWEVTTVGKATLRQRFAFPDPAWQALEWVADGSGFLAGLESVGEGRLYWFPADGSEPVLLLAGPLDVARWAPPAREVQPSSVAQPAMVLVEYTSDRSLLHFIGEDGADVVVRARGVDRYTSLRVGGGRVYYDTYYTDRNGIGSLRVSSVLGGCHPPLVSGSGGWLAWLCDDGLPDLSAMISGTAEIHFRLVVTDGDGRNPRQVWSHTEQGPDYRSFHPVSWREDGAMVYLSRPQYGAAWAYFDYNPGILALDVNTGQATQIGDLVAIHDGLVSGDGTWLVQSRIGEEAGEGASVVLRSLVDGTERTVACAEGTEVTGDFSFSPDNAWLAWREWGTEAGVAKFLVRAVRILDGEPFTVHGDVEAAAPRIGGWLAQDDLVLVYPVQEDGTGGYSTVVTLPETGPGGFLSPYEFLGVLSGGQ
jgi:WD40 repeat protein